jgi:hypothetical protein
MILSTGAGQHDVTSGRVMAAAATGRKVNNILDCGTGGLGMTVITLTRVGQLTVMVACIEVHAWICIVTLLTATSIFIQGFIILVSIGIYTASSPVNKWAGTGSSGSVGMAGGATL